jgi:hypothetical protein
LEDRQRVDLAAQLAHEGELAVERLPRRAQREREAFVLEPGVMLRVRKRKRRFAPLSARPKQIDLRHGAKLIRPRQTLFLAFGHLVIDLGLLYAISSGGAALSHGNLGALQLCLEACARRLLLREAAFELWAFDLRKRLPLRDCITGNDVQIHVPGRDRIQRRAARGRHTAVDDDVAHERAALHDGDAQPRGVHGSRRGPPTGRGIGR